MKAISPKIREKAADFYPKFFKNLNAGATYTLESFPDMYKKTLFGMKGLFSENELKLMIDIFNATMLTPVLAGEHLQGSVECSIEFDNVDNKWEVKKEIILQKISKLHLFEKACIEIWANGFWYNSDDISEKNLDAWVEALSY